MSKRKKRNHKCPRCGKKFKSAWALENHIKDKGDHDPPPKLTREEALGVMEGMDDLSDGAWWAMAEDLGLDADDFVEHIERIAEGKKP